MLEVLSNKTFRSLFLAQVIALVGTGLATVALGLTAYDLAGEEAGAVLGTALAIKMIASVFLAPIAAALAERFPRKIILVSLDLARALVMVAFPFITEIWHIYVLIFILQAASAGFTPTLRATIPDVLPDERDYTHALALTQLSYDLESVISPMLAAALLLVLSSHQLFGGTVLGFIASAIFIAVAALPLRRSMAQERIGKRTINGLNIYLRTPRLQGLLAFTLSSSCASAMVIVNTVVLVQFSLALPQTATAVALAAFGTGSILSALAVPRLLDYVGDRTAMLAGSLILSVGLILGSLLQQYMFVLPLWVTLGVGYGLIQTPTGRLIRRSSSDVDRPTLFAAQFSLTHVCWLINYPLAGWLGATLGLPTAFIVLGGLAALSTVVALRLWPRHDPAVLAHSHDGLAPDHEHLVGGELQGRSVRHSHVFVLDCLHTHWPTKSPKSP